MSCTRQSAFISRGHFMKQEESLASNSETRDVQRSACAWAVATYFAVRCLRHLPTEAEALKNFLKAGCAVICVCVF